MEYYIGIDLGTTACKCGLYDEYGCRLSHFSAGYPTLAEGSCIWQKPADWYNAVKKCIQSVCKHGGVRNISAISFSTQGISVVPVGAAGECLTDIVSWLDMRAEAQTKRFGEAFGEKLIYERTGKRLSAAYSLPKIVWLLENDGNVRKKAAKFLFPLDYLNFLFTGRAVTDYSIASGTMLFDLAAREWDREFMSWSKISDGMLPEVKSTGESVGKILPHIASDLGISGDANIIVGGQDQKISAAAAGIARNRASVSLGTSTAISVLSDSDIDRPEWARFALNEREDIYESALGTTGAAVKWLQSLLGAESYDELDELGERAGRSGGAEADMDFSGKFSLKNLDLSTSRGNIVYSLYERICGEIASRIEPFENIGEIKVFGGGAKSKLWRRLLTQKAGIEVTWLKDSDIAVYAAAEIAAGGFKRYD